MDPATQKLAEQGVGYLLAAIFITLWLRAIAEHKSEMKSIRDRHDQDLQRIIDKYDARDDKILQVIEGNTGAIRTFQISLESVASITTLQERIDRLAGETNKSRG